MSDSMSPSIGRVLLAAMVVAVADMLDAVVVWVVIYQRSTVQRIFQAVATGLLGPDSFNGGAATAVLGGMFHCVVALGWTLVFLFLLRQWPWLRQMTASTRGAVLAGLVYGAAVWLLMDGVVLPLSRARATPVTAPWFWIQLATHPFVVGLPISLMLGRAGRAVAAAPVPEAASGAR
jgi:hypothetical protein